MIVSEVMTTRLVAVTPETTLSHAAHLMRQHQFHHLPVVRIPAQLAQWYGNEITVDTKHSQRNALPFFEGLLTAQDIDLASAVDAARFAQDSGAPADASWQEQHVADVMQRAIVTVTPSTSVAAAAHLLVERGLDSLPVVAPAAADEAHYGPGESARETRALLVGLLTRSDLLLAFARALGSHEPGVDVHVLCPAGDLTALAQTLLLAAELHIAVRSSIAAPLEGSVPHTATLRLGTIHPAPLLVRMQEAHIAYTVMDRVPKGESRE